MRIRNPKFAIFISGRGSTLQAALDLMAEVRIGLVVSSKANVWGLARARRSGVRTLLLDKKINWQDLLIELRRSGITDIFLLGFMRIIPQEFLQDWGTRIYNLHPSLLPNFAGANGIEDSFAAKAEMGVSIHKVIAQMDAGEVLLQQSVGLQSEIEWARHRIAFSEQHLVRTFLRTRGNCAVGL